MPAFMHGTRFDSSYIEENKDFKKREVTVTPGTGRAVSLGLYSIDQPEPDFIFDFDPNMEEEMGIATSRLNISDERQYIMMLQLHNFGSKTCTVTVRRTRTK